jgi:peptidoglycan/xylan/chitin deacetylase (PgdA/CDA1 family)
VLAYHDPEPAAFERHVTALARRYSLISLDALLAAARTGELASLPERPLLVTLDDGWAGNVALLPVLERHGVRPAIFLTTAVVGTSRHFWWTHATDQADAERLKRLPEPERLRELAARGFTPETEYPDRQALSLDEIRAMAASVDFGAHTRSHPVLPECTDDRAAIEIAGSFDDVEQLTGVRAKAFAYPNGDASERDAELARQAGFECAFTVETGYDAAATDRYRLRRITVPDSAGTSELVARASGAYGALAGWLRRR